MTHGCCAHTHQLRMDEFASKGGKFAGSCFSLNCSWGSVLGFVELSWYHRHSRWISQLLRLHLQHRPHPLPAVCLSSLLSACQGNRCALRTRKAVTPSSSEPAENIHAHKDGRDNGMLSNGNQRKLIASFSSVAQLTCYKNHQHSFWAALERFHSAPASLE